ncbi:MAG: RluA family pseudouridine synthase [Myxococcota bacterium]
MILPPEARGMRLDQAVRQRLIASGRQVSVREVRLALKRGTIVINGRIAPPGRRAAGDEQIDIARFVARAESILIPCADPRVTVIADTEDVLVLDKPSGMATLPLRIDETGTLLHAAAALRPEIATAGPPLEGGAVHRLDTGTSGVVLFAKSKASRHRLRRAFRYRAVRKTYWALTVAPPWTSRTIAAHLAGTGPKMRVVDEGLEAQTDAFVMARDQESAWIKADTHYGRRHQVRVHLSHAGAPLFGDALYGGPPAQRLGLHASEVRLPDGRLFAAPLPPDLTALLEAP